MSSGRISLWMMNLVSLLLSIFWLGGGCGLWRSAARQRLPYHFLRATFRVLLVAETDVVKAVGVLATVTWL